MKRLDFLKEMKNSLFSTVKSVTEPLLEEKAAQFDGAADQLLGIKWVYLGSESDLSLAMDQKFISGQPIVILREGEGIRALSGICPVCLNLLVLSSLYTTLKCLLCDKDYNFNNLLGELEYTELPVKKQNQDYYIGINSIKK